MSDLIKTRKIDFKNFTLNQLRSFNKWITFRIENNTLKPADNLTISEHFLCDYLGKGSENMYFDFSVYSADDPNDETEHKIKCHTKDQHEDLKRIIKAIIKQA